MAADTNDIRPTDPALVAAHRWREFNRPFEANDFHGPSVGRLWDITDRGTALVLTAVHGVRHRRDGAGVKANDANTGGLALVLAHETRCSYGVVTRTGNGDDANSVVDHPFKLAMADKLHIGPGTLLIDLHGMSDHPTVDVAIGLGVDPDDVTTKAAHRVAARLRQIELRVDLGGEVTGLQARGDGTVTRWAQQRGASAFQVEIARHLRTFAGSAMTRARFVNVLGFALAELHKGLSPIT